MPEATLGVVRCAMTEWILDGLPCSAVSSLGQLIRRSTWIRTGQRVGDPGVALIFRGVDNPEFGWPQVRSQVRWRLPMSSLSDVNGIGRTPPNPATDHTVHAHSI